MQTDTLLLLCENHSFRFAMENICRLFFPQCKILRQGESEERIVTRLHGDGSVSVALELTGARAQASADVTPTQEEPLHDTTERRMEQLLFILLTRATGDHPPWGMLTGIRPSKLYRQQIAQRGRQAARQWLAKVYFVSEPKLALLDSILQQQAPLLCANDPMSFSLYVAIPFCPSRCSYCSFVSHSITNEKAQTQVVPYVAHLCEELAHTAAIAGELGLHLDTIYFGGGTPTALSAEQLDAICTAIQKNFHTNALREYTVEAGRPDTISPQILQTLQAHGVARISINPQTLNDAVLQAIGRAHTAQQTLAAYRLAQQYGFTINMDIIAGLPGDSLAGFQHTLEQVLACAPQNITVHTLAQKRASQLAAQKQQPVSGEEVQAMLQTAQAALTAAGYDPYYLYRQSRCAGNLENVGWAKPGTACLYNVNMMEEEQTVLAVGAGGVTKLKNPNGTEISRIFHYKFPYEYNSRFQEILARKQQIRDFYALYGTAAG